MTEVIAPVRGLIGARASSHAEHLAVVGPLPRLTADELVQLVADAGLTGRGGAGFPSSRKLTAVVGQRSPVVIANGAEGEPASSKDRALLTLTPHLVLDGLVLAARGVGSRAAYLYAPEALLSKAIRPALAQRRDKLPITLVASPATFVSGQETAVVAAVQGLRAVPTNTPPPIYVKGVKGRATLVHNVETLAQLALIARYGATWFRERGTHEDPGTRLLTISGSVLRPNVYEVAGGTTLGEAISSAGGASEPLQAVLVGGYHGGWVPWTVDGVRSPMTRAGLSAYEANPGAGVLIALPTRRCGLEATAEIAAYLAGQNAGQCGPCRNGLPTLAAHLGDLARGKDAAYAHDEILRLVGMVDGRGACHHPTGTARMVRTALRTFRGEVDHHLHRECTGVRGAREGHR
jgi:NADH:ubiquinone oxidoreductase subunit F (NADH-binding)